MKGKEVLALICALVLITAGNIVNKLHSLAMPSLPSINSLSTFPSELALDATERLSLQHNVVGYAVTVTKCMDLSSPVLEGSAVVAELVHNNSARNQESDSKYDYKLYAFLDEHQVSDVCETLLQRLGYTTLRKPVPVDVSAIESSQFQQAMDSNGCCGASEFLKLWSYTLTDHQAVIHLDLDVLVLKPLDDMIDSLIMDPSLRRDQYERLHVMRDKHYFVNKTIQAFITRDYSQVQQQQKWQEYSNMPVQGGFFVVKPSMTEFRNICEAVVTFGSNYTVRGAWGGMMWGRYWGMPQIQGLLAFYYTRQFPYSAVELHNCHYNTLVSTARYEDKCMNGMEECDECWDTSHEEIIVAHPIFCGKFYECASWTNPKKKRAKLCKPLLQTWSSTRRRLEERWAESRVWEMSSQSGDMDTGVFKGYCFKNRSFIPMAFKPDSLLPKHVA